MNQMQASAEMLELLAALVRFPSENHPPFGNEAEAQAYLQKAYEAQALEIHRLCPADAKGYPDHPAYLKREFDGRENLIGIWRGKGGGKSLLLTGHMDVAPKEPLPWVVTQPYEPLIRDGRMYGRGTADMKAGLVCAYEAVRRLKEKGFVPKGDVILESVIDEEYAGANGTAASRMEGYNADFGIILEATGLTVCPACVGGLVTQMHVQGIGGMPYTGEEIPNPAYDIAELVLLIRDFSELRMKTVTPPDLWAGTVQGAQVSVLKVKAGEVIPEGQLSTPIDAWTEFNIQTYPGEEEEDVLAALRAFIDAHYRAPESVRIERQYRYCRPTSSDPNHPGVQKLAACARAYTDRARVCGAMFSCDMFELTEVGKIPSVVFGPIGERLHAPDEWVDLESMEICVRTLMDFIVEWCG